MAKKMLIDATHTEETRVAVVDDKRLLEFDYESRVRKQLKGNIYLAKVTRVEPSLQAAFVNFGGNRHGFLPFSEIHPDYFRIPVADREALIEAQKAELQEHDEEMPDEDEDLAEDDNGDDEDEVVEEVGGADKPAEDDDTDSEEEKASSPDSSDDEEDDNNNGKNNRRGRNNRRGGRNNRRAARNRQPEKTGGDGTEPDRPFRFNLRRQYKIQEVVKRGQIMLIQVSKEERGNKGAAVTTYLSLPGRYCVLMPNSPRGGGVSRKIASYKDRKRMREILKELNVPEGMSVILRTAGVSRSKAEIKRDLDYLLRLWNTIREDTLQSTAPALIYEEGNLIKRSIRDLYDKDINEVLVSGEEGYKGARNFMKMLIPSHVKKVKEYTSEKAPLFHQYHVESQISEIAEPSVTMKSGGYLVINPTEALVSVDVNSGKATKERHIEETALKTNMEAAEEVARQLRLRDLGGLVVIDFIDMEDRRNNRKVENKLKEALSKDRARIQVGRISSFGLLELSRQRMNPSLTEAQFEKCPHCQGVGNVRTLDFAAITAIRALEEEGIKGNPGEIELYVSSEVAFYLLNNKRSMLVDIERRYGFRVDVKIDEDYSASNFRLEVVKKTSGDDDTSDSGNDQKGKDDSDNAEDDSDNNQRKGGRKRGRRGGRRRTGSNNKPHSGKSDDQDNQDQDNSGSSDQDNDDQNEKSGAKKRQPRKTAAQKKKDTEKSEPKEDDAKAEEKKGDDKKASKPRGRRPKKQDQDSSEDSSKPEKSDKADQADKGGKADKAASKKVPEPSNDTAPSPDESKDYETVNEPPKQKKKGWWNKIIE